MALVVLGLAAGRWPIGPTDTTSATSPSEFGRSYALVLSSSSSGNAVSEPRLEEIVREYGNWADGLRLAGQLIVAEKLSSDLGIRLFAEDGQIVRTSEAIEEDTQRMGGLFLIRARASAKMPHRFRVEAAKRRSRIGRTLIVHGPHVRGVELLVHGIRQVLHRAVLFEGRKQQNPVVVESVVSSTETPSQLSGVSQATSKWSTLPSSSKPFHAK